MLSDFLPRRIPKRYVIVAMVFVGYVNFYYLHTNIGMAVVHMTSSRKIFHPNGTVELIKPEFRWNSIQKAMVISSFAYGRFFGPIGAVFAGRVGGATLYAVGILGSAAVTFCMPFCLAFGFYFFVAGSAISGLFESIAYASVSQIWSRWAPPDERAKIISLGGIGTFGGSVVSFLVSGWILHEWGWRVLFHVNVSLGTANVAMLMWSHKFEGVSMFVWFWIWLTVVKNDPSEDERMSEVERTYIKDRINNTVQSKKLVYPWREIVHCVPFWMGCLCKFGMGAGYTFTMMYLPQYIRDINEVDIKKIGYISLTPQICSLISMPLAGYVFDYIRSNRLLRLTNVHKLFVSIGLFFGTLAFLGAAHWPNFIVGIICMCIFQFFGSCTVLDIKILVLDLAPRYAAFMNSVATSFYTAASILTPMAVGFIVTSHSQFQWNICFIILGVLYPAIALMFLKFASAELQPWANYSPDNLERNENENCTNAKSSYYFNERNNQCENQPI